MRPRSLVLAMFLAGLSTAASATDIGLKGWGPRVGVSSDPDQIVGGAHFDLGEFTRNLRFQPSVELGVGDDIVSVFGNAMTAYYFPVNGSVTPYAGAQLTAWLIDVDDPDGDPDPPGNNEGFDDDWDDGFNAEIGLAALGGIETRFRSGTRFLAELQVELTNHPEIKVMVGWTFGGGTPPPTSR